jgi:RNA polymerase sigma-70 factor, ECF subfamily
MSRSRSWFAQRPARPILAVMESDGELLLRLRSGDERAFIGLVERYHEPMLRLAPSFVPNRAIAEEVVQDTWLAALRGLGGFEGRSSMKTWLFSILVNQARKTGTREHRSIPVADPEPVVDPARFDASGGWADPPEHWIEVAQGRMEVGKLADRIRVWIEELPARQREVVLLRDVEGMSSEQVCAVLALTDVNQRVLLHRGRSRLRQLFEDEFREVR